MPGKQQMSLLVACVLVAICGWTPSPAAAQSQQLQRPTRPERFNSPGEVQKYVEELREYMRANSLRYGKRLAPNDLMESQKEVKYAEETNEANKKKLEEMEHLERSKPNQKLYHRENEVEEGDAMVGDEMEDEEEEEEEESEKNPNEEYGVQKLYPRRLDLHEIYMRSLPRNPSILDGRQHQHLDLGSRLTLPLPVVKYLHFNRHNSPVGFPYRSRQSEDGNPKLLGRNGGYPVGQEERTN